MSESVEQILFPDRVDQKRQAVCLCRGRHFRAGFARHQQVWHRQPFLQFNGQCSRPDVWPGSGTSHAAMQALPDKPRAARPKPAIANGKCRLSNRSPITCATSTSSSTSKMTRPECANAALDAGGTHSCAASGAGKPSSSKSGLFATLSACPGSTGCGQTFASGLPGANCVSTTPARARRAPGRGRRQSEFAGQDSGWLKAVSDEVKYSGNRSQDAISHQSGFDRFSPNVN